MESVCVLHGESREVWADEQTVALPEWLTGTYTLVFADDDGGCYYGEIEL